jgi:hypothetical protein
MGSAVRLREDYSAAELRALARRSKNVNQSRRLLSLAAVRDGMDRGSAARIGGMDRQTLRDWVHRFNALGPEGLIDNWTEGPKPRLSAEQLGFSHISARPRHPAQDERISRLSKMYGPPRSQGVVSRLAADPVCFNVSGLEELPPAMMEIRALRSS